MTFRLLLPILMLVGGIILMLWTIRFNRKLLTGQENSIMKYFLGAFLFGVWVFLISIGGILTLGFLSSDDSWTTYQIMEIIVFGILGGLIAIVGSLWQFFTVAKFRDLINKKLSQNNK